MNLITDLQYFPSIILYKISNDASNIIFKQYEYYKKMSFRNRCEVAGSRGPIHLSIPLEKGRDQKTVMKEARIRNAFPGQDHHWKTILPCYSRSPWFEFPRDELEQFYRKPFTFLLDWNLACFEWTCRILAFPVRVTLTEAWRPSYEEGNWLDIRGQ